MNRQQAQLRYVVRFKYGDALPSMDEERKGAVKVFGSNGPYAYFSQANTKAPAIVIGRKGSYGKVNWSDEPVFASDTTFFVDATTTKHHLRWLFYMFQTLNIDKGSNETAVPGLNRDDVYQQKIFIPSIFEQRSIAEYLDRETAKIDALISAMKHLLDLLAEKRRALITHAVTRGLDSNVPMRDSGVEWLGEIPAHWNVEYARWLFKEIDERSTTEENELLTVSHLTGVTPRSKKDVNMFMAESLEGYKICQTGDLAVNTLWAWMGAMGVAFQKGIVSPSYHIYRSLGQHKTRYLDYLVRIPVFANEVTRYSKGVWSSRLRLYPEEFFKLSLPIPPLEEQQLIADYLEKKILKTDNLYNALQKSVKLINERRSTLIAEAVSGKIQVTE